MSITIPIFNEGFMRTNYIFISGLPGQRFSHSKFNHRRSLLQKAAYLEYLLYRYLFWRMCEDIQYHQ